MNIKHYLLYTLVLLLICFVSSNSAFSQEKAYTGSLYTSLSSLPYATSVYNQSNIKKPSWKKIGKITKPDNSNNYIKKPYHNPNLVQELRRKQELAKAKQLNNEKIKQNNYEKKLHNMCINSLETRRVNKKGYNHLNQKVSSRTVVPFKDFRKACTGLIKESKQLSSNY